MEKRQKFTAEFKREAEVKGTEEVIRLAASASPATIGSENIFV